MPHATLTSDCASHAAHPVSPSTSAAQAVHWHQPVTRAAQTSDTADSSAQPPDLDSSPGLAPGEMMPTPASPPAPSSWSDIGTPLPPAAPLNGPQDSQ